MGGGIIVDKCNIIKIEGDANDPGDVEKARDRCMRAGRTNPDPVPLCTGPNTIKVCNWMDYSTPQAPNKYVCEDSTTDVKADGTVGGTCTYQTEDKGECKEGKRVVDINIVQQTGTTCANNCKKQTAVTIPCGRSVLALPFFGALQFILAVLLIGVVYFFIRKKKVRGKRK